MNEMKQTYSCSTTCHGNFVGPHQCIRTDKSYTISCLGKNNCVRTFKTKNDFNRHYRTVHLHFRIGVSELLDCPVPGCRRIEKNAFRRKDNLLQHRRLVHQENVNVRLTRLRVGDQKPDGLDQKMDGLS